MARKPAVEADAAQGKIFLDLVDTLGLDVAADDGLLRIAGTDPVITSRHRIGGAVAAAIAAQASGIRKIWKMRTGQSQDIAVDLRRAVVPGLRTCFHVDQNGHRLELFPRSSFADQDFYPTRDGRRMFILRTQLYPENIARTLDVLGCTYDPKSIALAMARWNAVDLEDAFAERKVIGTFARTRDEWLSHPQGTWLDQRPVVEITKIGDSDPRPFARDAARPLTGVRVLDIAHVIAGPAGTRVLAEQGADVLRASSPHHLDNHLVGIDTGLGKRCANIDLERDGDAAKLVEMAARADVVMQSWRHGSLAKRGLSAEAIAARNPGVIYASITAYGSGGPWAERGGYDPVGQVASGLAIAEDSAAHPRLSPVVTLNDYLTAYLVAAGVTAALIRRATEGGSYHVRASLTRTSMWIQSLGALPKDLWPQSEIPFEERDHDFHELESVYGTLRLPKPIAEFSKTPAYWARGPQPFGAGPLVWS
jgi:crotonobetainyl-CoA:carnitine CoA-transferase CaiB-like acyl-CoA transferase